jgi:small subunit ribosomal protein S7
MPRRKVIAKRDIPPDPLYQSTLATKFVNCVMQQGKKSTAEGIFYGALELVKERTKDDPVKILKKAVDNVKPILEVKSRRVGGATYQVPVEVNPGRRQSLAIRWLIEYASDRGSEKTMREKLAAEILDAAQNRGNAIKKKEDTHKMAEANKAFAHYRW